ncbi:uncharacterized protein [Nicotiana tomentosiformis]|uniref:uncharacterized protein n=1 Tax=Nicotiana tomentosiformis TaxID=4098 RepID=UPI00388C5D8F
MLRAFVMDFGDSHDQFLPLFEFAYDNNYQSSIQMAPYEALYGRRCRSPVGCFEPKEAKLLGTDLVWDALEKVAYVDRKFKNVAYMVGERDLLRVSPMKGMMRFGEKGKLSPRYIGPFDILERAGEVA